MRRIALGLLVVSACSPNDSGNTNVACAPLTEANPAVGPSGWQGSVFTIVMENHSRGDILGNKAAPFINRMALQGAVAEGYHDSFIHPSEANYLWMVAGQNFGVLDDEDPAAHSLKATSHIADQLEMSGISWKSYQESMGAPCGLTSHGRYAAKHDPFVYFSDINGWNGSSFDPSQRCIDHVVDYSQLDKDIANNAVPRYVFITPNLDNDMHDGSIEQGDAWLANELPKIMATPAYQNGGVIFLLWDEGGGYPAGDDPPFIAFSPNIKPGFKSQVDYDTSSYLKTVQSVLGVNTLPCGETALVASVPAMDDLFMMPMTKPSPSDPTQAQTY
ncbi:MAG TPA: alkaline phosphatase family protein [Kofleriaceae bacterium]